MEKRPRIKWCSRASDLSHHTLAHFFHPACLTPFLCADCSPHENGIKCNTHFLCCVEKFSLQRWFFLLESLDVSRLESSGVCLVFFVFSNEVVSCLIWFRNAAEENKLCLQTKLCFGALTFRGNINKKIYREIMDNDGFGGELAEWFVFCKIYLPFDWDHSVIHAVPVETLMQLKANWRYFLHFDSNHLHAVFNV